MSWAGVTTPMHYRSWFDGLCVAGSCWISLAPFTREGNVTRYWPYARLPFRFPASSDHAAECTIDTAPETPASFLKRRLT